MKQSQRCWPSRSKVTVVYGTQSAIECPLSTHCGRPGSASDRAGASLPGGIIHAPPSLA